MDHYPYAKFHYDMIIPFAPKYAQMRHSNSVFFCFSFSLQPRYLHRFSRAIRQM